MCVPKSFQINYLIILVLSCVATATSTNMSGMQYFVYCVCDGKYLRGILANLANDVQFAKNYSCQCI